MRLSVKRDDPGYHPLAHRAVKDIYLDGYLITCNQVVTIDTMRGEIVKYKTWPDGEIVFTNGVWPAYDPWFDVNEYSPAMVTAHGDVSIMLNDGWRWTKDKGLIPPA